MSKYMLFALPLFVTPAYTMENSSKLSHRSPHVIRIHSQEYLDNIEKHPTRTLAAINNSYLMSLYPNTYTATYFTPMLEQSSALFIATKGVLDIKKTSFKPNYAISIGQAYSFAGHAQGTRGDVYASIPIAAAYALDTNSANHILVIDENITPDTTLDYFNHGNGSIFYPQNNPALLALFNGKIVMHDKIPHNNFDTFLQNTSNGIDLAFYNLNIDNPDISENRTQKIISLLCQLIPTVFILSGDQNKYQNTACALMDYIIKRSQEVFSSLNTSNPSPQPSLMQSTLYNASILRSSISSNISLSESLLLLSLSNHPNYADEDSSEHTDENNVMYVFKVTTDPAEALSFDGANYIFLANEITITEDGVMEIDINDYSTGYHSPSSSSSNSSSILSDSENSQTYTEELIFK